METVSPSSVSEKKRSVGSSGALSRKISARDAAAALAVACACGACVLGFTPWRVVVPALLAASAVPFVYRSLAAPATAAKVSTPAATFDHSPPVPVRKLRQMLWALAVLIACTEILVIRKPDAFLKPQFWQEDVFLFQDARQEGLPSIFEMLDRPQIRRGQTVMFQRIIAYFGKAVPPREAPLYYSAAAMVVTLAAAAYIMFARIGGLGMVTRAFLALALMITFNTEQIYLTVVNLQWILTLVLLLILMEREPETRAGRALLFLATGILCLTGPFVTFLWTLFLVRALVRRTPCSVALFGISLACAVWQIFRIQIVPTQGKVHLTDPYWQVAFGQSYVGQLFLGSLLDDLSIHRVVYVGLSLAVFLGLAAYAWRRRDAEVAVLLAASLLFLGSAALTYRVSPEALTRPGHRYFFVPYTCLTWAFIIAAGRLWGSGWCIPCVAAVAAIVVASIPHLTMRPLADLRWEECSRYIDGPRACLIYTNPFPQFFIYCEAKPSPTNSPALMLPDPLPPRWR
jgi:hypothetical protein